ncbi:hypothetical protein MTIN_07600 [Moorella thermoacetica]|nr:hypothetical protein MTIN_07600 [Moorella thermoacetica]
MVFKKHIFKISLALILLLTGLLCIYAIYNYHGDIAPTRSRTQMAAVNSGLTRQAGRLLYLPGCGKVKANIY